MNEFQLTIGETTFGGRPELVDTTGMIIDYGSLIYLDCNAHAPPEVIKVMTELVQNMAITAVASPSPSPDPNEIWIMR